MSNGCVPLVKFDHSKTFKFVFSLSYYCSQIELVLFSGVATEGFWGGGLEPPSCGKCDVIFSYIYTNTTKLVFHLSYLVRLDWFSMRLIAELLLQILTEICIKMRYFYWKIAKIAPLSPAAGGNSHPDPRGLWRLGRLVVLPEPFRWMSPRKNSRENQQSDHVSRHGLKIIDRNLEHEMEPNRLRCGSREGIEAWSCSW